MKLSEVEQRKSVTISKVDTNCNCILRVMTLGLVEGTKVTVVSKTKSNIEVRIFRGATVGISKHCAEKLIVV
jgi:Fe2+ transport system protein FeoA